MEITESILASIRKLLGPDTEYTHFDPDIIIHINSAFSVLQQLGVGPAEGFAIQGSDATWEQFLLSGGMNTNAFNMVKSYVYLKVKLSFDPPLSSAAVDSINRQIAEYEWRLLVAAEANEG